MYEYRIDTATINNVIGTILNKEGYSVRYCHQLITFLGKYIVYIGLPTNIFYEMISDTEIRIAFKNKLYNSGIMVRYDCGNHPQWDVHGFADIDFEETV